MEIFLAMFSCHIAVDLEASGMGDESGTALRYFPNHFQLKTVFAMLKNVKQKVSLQQEAKNTKHNNLCKFFSIRRCCGAYNEIVGSSSLCLPEEATENGKVIIITQKLSEKDFQFSLHSPGWQFFCSLFASLLSPRCRRRRFSAIPTFSVDNFFLCT